MLTKLTQLFRPKQAPAAQAPSAQPAAAPRPRPIRVDDADFDEIILGSDKLAVVDFWADWCEPCHVMAATVQFLAEDFDERVVVAKLDVEENATIPERYTLLGVPTLIFFRNGAEIDRHTGIISIGQLSERVEVLLRDA